jgi:thiol-disulfide isomerase/thioredoxin
MLFLSFAWLWVGLMVGVLSVVEQPGFLRCLLWIGLWLGGAGLLQGLVRMAAVWSGKRLVLTAAGRPQQTPVGFFAFLVGTLMSLALYSAVLAGLGGLVQSWVLRTEPPPLPSGPNLPVLGLADAGWKLETLDGQEVSFGTFQGRAVFLNVWATWCLPCVAEVPSIQDLYDTVKDEGVAVVLVTEEPLETVRPFVERKRWHVPVYLARRGLPAALQTSAIPATFLINHRGEVIYRHTGRADWNTEDCRTFLRRLQRE